VTSLPRMSGARDVNGGEDRSSHDSMFGHSLEMFACKAGDSHGIRFRIEDALGMSLTNAYCDLRRPAVRLSIIFKKLLFGPIRDFADMVFRNGT
jgi:hypothetical protein